MTFISTPCVDRDHIEPPQPRLNRSERRSRTAWAFASGGTSCSRGRREELLDYVVRINMGVARGVAGGYLNRGIEGEDLVQVAYVALTRAAGNFDPSRHQDFLAYAVPSMRGELKKHFRDLGWAVRPPRRIQDAHAQITRAEGELVQRYGRSPRASEIAAHLGLAVDDVVDAMSSEGCFTPASLDRLLTSADGVGGVTVGDLLGEEDASWLAAETRMGLAPALRQLRERDRRIIYLRFYEERTQREIARDIGVTQMQVSRLLSRIMGDLRTQLTADDALPLHAALAPAS